jgi:hypothetical protein
VSNAPKTVLCALALLAGAASLTPCALAQDARRKQEIIFPPIAARTVDAAPFTVVARATSGLPVSLELISGPAVLEKRVLRLTGQPGLVLIRASQPGNPVFAPATPMDQLLEVLPRPSIPVIVTQPSAAYAEIGQSVSLSVGARGEPAPGYQWRKDGTAITGATRETFTISSALLSDSGVYDVVATNPSGSAASARARVTIAKRQQTIYFRPSGPVAPGQQIALSATASSGLPARFEIVSGPGILNGDLLSSPGGTVTVQAEQPGDASFNAAAPAIQTFVFAGLGQQIP